MKYLLVIIDGATDDPIAELQGLTPLEVARMPHLAHLSHMSSFGLMQTVYEGFPVESLVCIMGILGYSPQRYYPSGRASFEALAHDISLDEQDLAFRCNIVKTTGLNLEDFTAGMISDEDARYLLTHAIRPDAKWELHPGQSYRNLLIIRDAGLPASTMQCSPPHMHIGEAVHTLMPFGTESRSEILAARLREFLDGSHDTFKALSPAGEHDNTMLWLWSPSTLPHLPSFSSLYSKNGTVIAGLDFMRGLGIAAGLAAPVVSGATGYIDTDYRGKAAATAQAFASSDFVLVHINATDEAGHLHDYTAKTAALEATDALVIGPLLQFLQKNYPSDFSIAVCADHKTRCSDGKHIGEPTPFLVYRAAEPVKNAVMQHAQFTERATENYTATPSLEFLHSFFRS